MSLYFNFLGYLVVGGDYELGQDAVQHVRAICTATVTM